MAFEWSATGVKSLSSTSEELEEVSLVVVPGKEELESRSRKALLLRKGSCLESRNTLKLRLE
jgi:hypothetical protein